MQEKHVYPNGKLYLALMDVLSKHGHTSVIVEVFIPLCMLKQFSVKCHKTYKKPIIYQWDYSAIFKP